MSERTRKASEVIRAIQEILDEWFEGQCLTYTQRLEWRRATIDEQVAFLLGRAIAEMRGKGGDDD